MIGFEQAAVKYPTNREERATEERDGWEKNFWWGLCYSRFCVKAKANPKTRVKNENRFASLAKRRRISGRGQDCRRRRLEQRDRHRGRAQCQGARAGAAVRQDQGLSRGISSA